MKKILIIPEMDNIFECVELSKKYDLGFEYNDFFWPDVLDDDKKISEIISEYKKYDLPEFTTLHGAFFDVIPFSVDSKIREISKNRILKSIWVAKEIGAKAVIFHTNYNPFLNSKSYIDEWIEKNVQFWSEILKSHLDIDIYLENMFDTSPDIMEALSEKLCEFENYGICFDYAHASLSKVNPEEWVKRLGKYIKHVHINDNDGISDLHLAWGDGKLDRQELYACYEKYIENATVLVEVVNNDNKIKSIDVLKNEKFF